MSTTKTRKSNELFAGVDLHSNNLVIAIVDAQGAAIKQTKLFCEMHAVEAFLKPYQSRLRAIAVESTFNWYWLVDGLQDLGYSVRLANPAAIEQYEGLKHADDKSDAFFLAELLRLGILPTGYIYDRKLRPVRDLFRRRMLLVQKRTSLMLSLRSLHTRTKGYPLPLEKVKSMEIEELAELFDHEAEQMVSMVQKSVIDELDFGIKVLEKHADEAARQMPHYDRLHAVAGIGRILSATIMLEIGDIHRFPSAEAFASYCRTVPSTKETNGKKKGENNRKCGNRYLSWAFIEAANFIRRYDENARKWFDRKAARTNSIIATKALACKLAKMVWYVLKEGSSYDSQRLFGGGAERDEAKPSGRANVSQRKGLPRKHQT